MPASDADFRVVVRAAPLVSIDLVLRGPEGRIFVGRRTNEPARGVFFVPGGAIRKDERLDDAFARILARETGLHRPRAAARFLGVYEHFYATNRYAEPGYGTHYVVIAYELTGISPADVRLDDQHSESRWMTEAELLAHPEVHPNTKAYVATHAYLGRPQ